MMILPTGISPSSDTTEYLKIRAQKSWHEFFQQVFVGSGEGLEELFQKRAGMFLSMDHMLSDLIEFCQSAAFFNGTTVEDLYHYPLAFAKVFTLIAKKSGLSSQMELDYVTRMGKVLWVRAFEKSTDDGLFIQSLKNYFSYMQLGSLIEVIFLGSILSNTPLWRFCDLASHQDYPFAWQPALFALVPKSSSLETLESALKSLEDKNRDFKMAELLANPDSAYYLLKLKALAGLQSDQAPFLNRYLSSLVRGMMAFLRNPDFQQEDLRVYNHLIVFQFFAIDDVRARCDFLTDYVENLGIEEPDWPDLLANVFRQITDTQQRRNLFLSMASCDGFPETWKAAYYLIAEVDQPFEDVIAEWEQAKSHIDLPSYDSAAQSFFAKALEHALPRSIAKWSLRSWEDLQWRAEWEAQQKLTAYIWDILCDADMKSWAPLAKEYYLGVFLGCSRSDLVPVNVEVFQDVVLTLNGHLRLMRLLSGRKRACSDSEVNVFQRLLGYTLPIEHWSSMITEVVPKIGNESKDFLRDFMRRCIAFFFQNQAKPCFRQQLWMHLAASLLNQGKETGLQFLITERCLEKWEGSFPFKLQSFFQGAAENSKVVPVIVLSLYQMMGKAPFLEEKVTVKAIDYVKNYMRDSRIPVGSFAQVLEYIYGENSPFNQSVIEKMGIDFLRRCSLRVGYFVPSKPEEFIQMLWGFLDRSIHRHFQELYPFLRSLCHRFQCNEAIEIERIICEWQTLIQEELRVLLKNPQGIPEELRKKICPQGEPFSKQVVKMYKDALLTGKDS